MAMRECLHLRSKCVYEIPIFETEKSEFNAHLKNENSQKRSHKMVMKGRITYE